MNTSSSNGYDWILPYRAAIAQLIATRQLDEVIERWQEPHRKFHTLAHLKSILEQLSPSETAMVLAAFYHDAIYQPGAVDNEECSAALLHKHIRESSNPLIDSEEEQKRKASIVNTATRIILSTAQFGHKHDPEEERFFNIDCLVLLGDWEGLLEYEIQIRSEFQSVGKEQYLTGRRSFLEQAASVFPENGELLLRLRNRISGP